MSYLNAMAVAGMLLNRKCCIPLLVSLALATTCALVPPRATAAVGRTASSFSVTQTGSANYTIPLWVPPGPRGLQPRMSLEYNSGYGNGIMGPGWRLAGLSAIARCNRTIAQDGAASSVTLTYADAFCLDGRRLRLTSSQNLSTYGQDGTTYQSEIADFSLVTAHGVAGNGPASFTVKGQDGLTYEYGVGGNSLVTASGSQTATLWLLDKVTDRSGNTMVISYLSPSSLPNGAPALTGTSIPQSIQWTPSSYGASTFNYSMQFTYLNDNVPQGSLSGYVAGTSVVNRERLSNIKVISSGNTVKQYVLNYETSPRTGVYRMNKVTECADSAATDCFLPTTISYQNGQSGIANINVSTGTTVAAANTRPGTAITADVNGDGRADLIYAVLNGSALQWYVRFSTGSGFGSPVSIGASTSATDDVLVNDFLASGQSDILAPLSGTWRLYHWNGTSFTSTTTNLAVDPSRILGSPPTGGRYPSFVSADVDGDGRPDLVWASSSGGVAAIWTRLNTSTNGAISFSSVATQAYVLPTSWTDVGGHSHGISLGGLWGDNTQQNTSVRRLDFNGDGRTDIFVITETSTAAGDLNEVMTELTAQGPSQATTFAAVKASGTIPLNFNDDACTDTLDPGFGYIFISACNGSDAQMIAISAPVNYIVGVVDWDGDGRTDLLAQGSSGLQVYLSQGDRISGPIATDITTTGSRYVYLDIDGDGLDDLISIDNSAGSVSFGIHYGPGQQADLATSFTDGFGNHFDPSYTTIAQGNYAKGSGAAYPERDVQSSQYRVVSQVTQSDGIGGTFGRTYSYTGARENVQGYGFEGFSTLRIADSRSASLVTVMSFKRLFPYTGMPLQTDIYQHDGVTLASHASYSSSETVLESAANNQRHFPFIQSSTKQDYEVGGSKNGLLITTTTRSDTFDNYGNAISVTSTVTDNDSTSPYVGQSWTTTIATSISADAGSNWCLNIPTQITVTKSATNASAITRTTAFDSPTDYTHCRVNVVKVEPNSPTYALTRSLSYDSFGNINTVTVTGIGVTPSRVGTVDWGTTGQFPVTLRDPISNALGTSGYKTVRGYDYNLGVQTSEVIQSIDGSANNAPATSWQYDTFGRKTQETKPDGTYTTFPYYDCANVSGCIVGSHGLKIGRISYNADGTIRDDEWSIFDPLDRRVHIDKRLLSNSAYNRVDVQYDNYGRLHWRSMPCAYISVPAICANGTTLQYDALGRVVQTQRPISDSNTNLQTTTTQYAGRTTTSIDPQGKVTTKVTTVTGALGVSQDPTGYHQNLSYDAVGSLLSVTDSLSNTLFAANYDYGIAAFQRDVVDMDLDVSPAAGQHRHLNYNAFGELISWSDSKGQSFSQSYDLLSRRSTRVEPDLTTTWTYGSSAASHNVGQLTGVSANAYVETLSYDGVGRVAKRFITIPSDLTYEYDFTYATTGLLDTVTYPTSTSGYRFKLGYTYQNGFLLKVTDANSGTVYWQANATNAWGLVNQETLGNGVVTNRTFDNVTGWPSLVTSGLNGNAALQNESYLYDQVGNVTQRQNNNAGLTENFWYDDDYRLDHSTLNGTPNLQMQYDGAGNISSRSDVASGAAWSYDAVHKHAVTQAGSSAFSYTYDGNGNATSRNGVGINWTSYNHPSIINNTSNGESVLFAYNDKHERWMTALGRGGSTTETTYYIGDLLEKVITSGGSTDYRHYIYAGKGKVAVYSRASTGVNTVHYLREDRQGSVAAILNGDGTPYVKESFTAFGARRNACTWSGIPTNGQLSKISAVTRRGYTWHTALGAMGLNDMKGRIQDAITGRFLSADPTDPDIAVPQDFNRYSYARNNPLTLVDPSGFAVTKQTPVDPFTPVNANSMYTSMLSGASIVSLVGGYLESHPQGGGRQGSGGGAVGASSQGGNSSLSPVAEVTVSHDPATPTYASTLVPASSSVSPQGNMEEVTVGHSRPISRPPVVSTPALSPQDSPVSPVEVTVTGARPPSQSHQPLPLVIITGTQDQSLAANSWKRGPRYPCSWCGAPHGGLFGPYCPDCQGKSKDPKGGVPPNPQLPELDDDDTPLPELDDPAPMQVPDLPWWLLYLEGILFPA